MIVQVSLLFFGIALLYSMVGFGGGSSYIAILALFAFDYETIPKLALVCNLIVVSGGCYHFIKEKHFRWHLFWPFVITSVPFSYIGGRIPVSKSFFFLTLGTTLIIAGLRILYTEWFTPSLQDEVKKKKLYILLILGAAIGFVSGLVGIGGGIFLSPFLIHFKWGKAKEIAATASAFILVNSLSGLLGQMQKNTSDFTLLSYWPLFLSVLIAGQIGSHLASKKISPLWLKTLTALLVLFVGVRILLQLYKS